MYHLGVDESSNKVVMTPSGYFRHNVIYGKSRSGKTVLLKDHLENVAAAGAPVVAIDHHGDLSTLMFPGTPSNDEDKQFLQELRSKCDAQIYSFGGPGRQLSISPISFLSETVLMSGAKFDLVAAAFVNLIETPISKIVDTKMIIVQALRKMREDERHVQTCTEFANIINEYFSKSKDSKERMMSADIARRIRYFDDESNAELMHGEYTFSSDLWKKRPGHKTPIVIIYTGNLVLEKRRLAVGLIVNRIALWMMSKAPEELLIVGIDEVTPLIPPHPENPPSKFPIGVLMREGGKFNVGCIIASQNVSDVDKRILGQAEHVWLCQNTDPNNTERLRKMFPAHKKEIAELLPTLKQGTCFHSVPSDGIWQLVSTRMSVTLNKKLQDIKMAGWNPTTPKPPQPTIRPEPHIKTTGFKPIFSLGLTLTCPGCNTPNPTSVSVCQKCGRKL